MYYIILTVHGLLCLVLVTLVLLQQGKGADMGATLGGGSNTVFGAGGATDFVTRLTTGIAIGFMATSILLVRMYALAGSGEKTGNVNPLEGSVMQSESVQNEVVQAVSDANSDIKVEGNVVASSQPETSVPVSPPKAPGDK
jgi:preprotein translocase subunit SecG